MSKPTKHKNIQVHILKYSNGIGWANISQTDTFNFVIG